MPGNKKVNSNLNIDGGIKVSTVPNLGTNATYILTQNPSTKEISQRTNSEIISDLNLATTSWVSTNYIPKTHPVYNVTQANIDSWNSVAQNYLGYVDDRIISPNDLGTKKIQFGFTSFTNNNSGPWADFIHFGGYQDASGGNQNLIVFNKTNFGIRQYQGTFQSGTSYNNYVDYWHTGNFNPNNYITKSGLNIATSWSLVHSTYQQSKFEFYGWYPSLSWDNSKAYMSDEGIFYIDNAGISQTSSTTFNVFSAQSIFNNNLILNVGRLFNPVTPTKTIGALHLTPSKSTNNYASSITFSGQPNTWEAQAGIYVQGAGAYGTKMYFATTNLHADGPKIGMILDSNGNVGIGTTSPQVKLSVHGAQSNIISTTTAVSKSVSGDVGLFIGGLAGTPNYGNWLQSMRESDGLVFPLSIQPNGGYVGIGTTSPSEKLDVSGSIKATSFIKSGGTSSQFLKADGSVDSNSYINKSSINVMTSDSWAINNIYNEASITFINGFYPALIWNTSSAYMSDEGFFYIDEAGINQMNYEYSNYFAGDVYIYSGLYVNLQFSFKSGAVKTNPSLVGKFATLTGGSNDFELLFSRSASGTGAYYSIQSVEQGIGYRDIVLQKDGGNVGIGIAPSEKLHVNGNVKATSFIKSGGTSTQILMANGDAIEKSTILNGYALANGGNATDNWSNTSSGLSLNPTLSGKTLNASGQTVTLRDATYGSISGIVQDSTNGPIANEWSNRLKTLHNNSQGYFTELAQSFTGTEGVWHRRNVYGTISSWKQLYDDSIWNAASLSYSGSTLTLTINGISKTTTINAGSGVSFTGSGSDSGSLALRKSDGTLAYHTGIYNTGSSLYAAAFYETSLKKYKTNIEQFDKSGIELLNELDIVTFDKIDGPKNKIGIIADNSPKEFLSEKEDAVDLYNTIFIQAKAIQELSETNNMLQTRIERLEEEIQNLRDLLILKLNK